MNYKGEPEVKPEKSAWSGSGSGASQRDSAQYGRLEMDFINRASSRTLISVALVSLASYFKKHRPLEANA